MTTSDPPGLNPIGLVLRRLIHERGLKVGEAAARAGMPQSQLSRYLAGRSNPRPATLRKVLAAIGAAEADVFLIGPDPTSPRERTP